MDYGPREVIAAFRAGDTRQAWCSSNTIWLCTSCYSCTVRCPAGIKVTDIMYELKRLAIKYKSWPEDCKNPADVQDIIDNIEKYGRNYEVGLMAKFTWARSRAWRWKFSGLGMKLFIQRPHAAASPTPIKGSDEIEKIIERAWRPRRWPDEPPGTHTSRAVRPRRPARRTTSRRAPVCEQARHRAHRPARLELLRRHQLHRDPRARVVRRLGAQPGHRPGDGRHGPGRDLQRLLHDPRQDQSLLRRGRGPARARSTRRSRPPAAATTARSRCATCST